MDDNERTKCPKIWQTKFEKILDDDERAKRSERMNIMKKEESIGIFDSGIGGVTVLKEIIKILPIEVTLLNKNVKQ